MNGMLMKLMSKSKELIIIYGYYLILKLELLSLLFYLHLEISIKLTNYFIEPLIFKELLHTIVTDKWDAYNQPIVNLYPQVIHIRYSSF